MAETGSAEYRPAIADYLPLARAAALAHEHLYPEQPQKETKTLDVLALALSALVPLYQRDMDSGAVRQISEDELAAGRFTRGATTVEFAQRPPLRFLLVERAALHGAIQRLMEDSLVAARVRLTMRQARPSPA